jgi:hypothetical protein
LIPEITVNPIPVVGIIREADAERMKMAIDGISAKRALLTPKLIPERKGLRMVLRFCGWNMLGFFSTPPPPVLWLYVAWRCRKEGRSGIKPNVHLMRMRRG